jgi:hypothetical protein
MARSQNRWSGKVTFCPEKFCFRFCSDFQTKRGNSKLERTNSARRQSGECGKSEGTMPLWAEILICGSFLFLGSMIGHSSGENAPPQRMIKIKLGRCPSCALLDKNCRKRLNVIVGLPPR